jgi:hypothetical protein
MPRHRVSPSASPMTGSSGASSTPRPLDFITSSGILDHPLSRVMTVSRLPAHDELKIAPEIRPCHDAD